MPKKGSHRKGQISDFTINEHANSIISTDRLRKTNRYISQQLLVNEVNVQEEITEENMNEGRESKQQRKSKKSDPRNDDNDDDHKYAYYPIDIWFLISKHIQPEDVGRFALICRQTAMVCASSSFWLHLYKSHYCPVDNLPVRLQPECMVRIGGLRACTIRSLFHCYKPFVDRLPTLAGQDFHSLVKRELVTSWCVRVKDHWLFCYKLRQKVSIGSRLYRTDRLLKNNKTVNMMNDVYHNLEEGCKILIITTPSFRPLLQNFGQQLFLKTINQSLSQGFVNFKVHLTFSNQCQEAISSVVYDPVLRIQTLDWWTPAYHTYLES